jgi:hypothetical protein
MYSDGITPRRPQGLVGLFQSPRKRRRQPYECVPRPAHIADLIAARRRRPSRAAAVRVYRRRPDPNHQPKPTAANVAHWPHLPPQEKGIDVVIAVDMMNLAFGGQYDALVPFSGDTDLLPPLEAIADLRLGHAEVACWAGSKPLRFSGRNLPWCHFLSAADWQAVTEDWKGRI